jgi:hypothetical protein
MVGVGEEGIEVVVALRCGETERLLAPLRVAGVVRLGGRMEALIGLVASLRRHLVGV